LSKDSSETRHVFSGEKLGPAIGFKSEFVVWFSWSGDWWKLKEIARYDELGVSYWRGILTSLLVTRQMARCCLVCFLLFVQSCRTEYRLPLILHLSSESFYTVQDGGLTFVNDQGARRSPSLHSDIVLTNHLGQLRNGKLSQSNPRPGM
jgi:hypothetical protein